MERQLKSCFISMDEEKPLAVIIIDDYGITEVPLKVFFADSLIDLSREMRLKYSIAFRDFIKRLESDD